MARLYVHRMQQLHRVDAKNVAVIVVEYPRYKMRSCFERTYRSRKRINTKLTRKTIRKLGWTESTHSLIYIYLSCQASVECRVISQYLFCLVYILLFRFLFCLFFLILLKSSSNDKVKTGPQVGNAHIYTCTHQLQGLITLVILTVSFVVTLHHESFRKLSRKVLN